MVTATTMTTLDSHSHSYGSSASSSRVSAASTQVSSNTSDSSETSRSSSSDDFSAFDDAVRKVVHAEWSVLAATEHLLDALTPDERLSLLDGDEPFWTGLRGILFDRYNRDPFVMGRVRRLGIPGIRFTDGPRGIVMQASTCFPVSMSRGATWDVALERRVGHAIGLEGRALGANCFAGVCINLPRHPAWGRVQETYAEDPVLLGAFGLALHQGVRAQLMTCVKHYALNSMENARFKVDVQVDDDATLHEVYLPHFRRLVAGGVSAVMSSYNSVRGCFVGENAALLTDVLRGTWGFEGFVMSDFIFGLRDAARSLRAGLDIEAPFQQQRHEHLRAALADGTHVAWSDVDTACRRILRTQLAYRARIADVPCPDARTVVFCDEHRRLAREAAARGMVLLKNEPCSSSDDSTAPLPLLPLDPRHIQTVAIIGRLAHVANTGDHGSSAVFSPSVVTAYEGLRAALPAHVAIVLEDSDSPERAAHAAARADFVLCLVGYDAADEGEYVVPSFHDNPALRDLLPPVRTSQDRQVADRLEGRKSGPRDDTLGDGAGREDVPGVDDDKNKNNNNPNSGIVPGAGGDRRSLRLRPRDVAVIEAASRASSRVVVGVVAAGAVIVEEWVERVPGVLLAWYAGCEGGHALADVLLGRVDASGRLPFAVPTAEAHLPPFDIDAAAVTYDRWFGQRRLDRLGVSARFPLGFGLSYTRFRVEDLVVEHGRRGGGDENEDGDNDDEQYLTASVSVTNVGARAGRHIVQIYGRPAEQRPDFPSRLLLAFQPVDVQSGRSMRVDITVPMAPLRRWVQGRFEVLKGKVQIEAAAFSGDPQRLESSIEF